MANTSSLLALVATFAFGAEELRIQRQPLPEELKSLSSVLRVTNVESPQGNRVAFSVAERSSGRVEVWVKSPDGKLQKVDGVDRCLLQRLADFPEYLGMRFWVVTNDGITAGCAGGTTFEAATQTVRVFRTSSDWSRFMEVLSVGSNIAFVTDGGVKKSGIVTKIRGGVWPGGLSFLDLVDGTTGIFSRQEDGTWKLELPRPKEITGQFYEVNADTPIVRDSRGSLYFGGSYINSNFLYKWNFEVIRDEKTGELLEEKGLQKALQKGFKINGEAIDRFGVMYTNGRPLVAYSIAGEPASARRFVDLFTTEVVIGKNNFEGNYPFSFGEVNAAQGLTVSATRANQTDSSVSGLAFCLDEKCQGADRAALAKAGISRIDGQAWVDVDGSARVFLLDENGRIDGQGVVTPAFAKIRKFAAEKLSVLVGSPANISWEVAYADYVEIDGIDGGRLPAKGAQSIIMKMPGPMKFTLKAYSANGVAIIQELDIDVTLPKPVITSVQYLFNPEQETTDFEITGTDLYDPNFQVRVQFVKPAGMDEMTPEETQELFISFASNEMIQGFVPQVLQPGTYKLWLDRDGINISEPVEFTVPTPEEGLTASKKTAKNN